MATEKKRAPLMIDLNNAPPQEEEGDSKTDQCDSSLIPKHVTVRSNSTADENERNSPLMKALLKAVEIATREFEELHLRKREERAPSYAGETMPEVEVVDRPVRQRRAAGMPSKYSDSYVGHVDLVGSHLRRRQRSINGELRTNYVRPTRRTGSR